MAMDLLKICLLITLSTQCVWSFHLEYTSADLKGCGEMGDIFADDYSIGDVLDLLDAININMYLSNSSSYVPHSGLIEGLAMCEYDDWELIKLLKKHRLQLVHYNVTGTYRRIADALGFRDEFIKLDINNITQIDKKIPYLRFLLRHGDSMWTNFRRAMDGIYEMAYNYFLETGILLRTNMEMGAMFDKKNISDEKLANLIFRTNIDTTYLMSERLENFIDDVKLYTSYL